MLKVSPDRFDYGPGAPVGSTLILWSLDDALCPGPQPEKRSRGSSCWLRCNDNCRCGVHRLVGIATNAVELGLGLRNRETNRGLVSRGPRPRAHAPRQELEFG